MNVRLPVIPENIVVHLGSPNSSAENVTVPFIDYIKNVASSEIYPTWPDSTIRANVLAQISFALNRVYTEFYRSRGYNFDITNSTAFDQSFVKGRDIFENVGKIVDEVFNDYIRRQGFVEPLFAQYCNGTTVTCDGLSQWGSAALGEQGLDSVSILRRYYGDNIEIVNDAPVGDIEDTAPVPPLRLGATGEDVRTLQLRLNRVSTNYPTIPKIYPVNGIFDNATEQAVRRFQTLFNLASDGVVGKATWYELARLWAGVKRLNELTAEGIRYEDVTAQYPGVFEQGQSGREVGILQYYLAFLAAYMNGIAPPAFTSVYDDATVAAVRDFQRIYGLPVTGAVDEATWNDIYDAYIGIIDSLPDSAYAGAIAPYPGLPLRQGARGEDVRELQEYINAIASVIPEVPSVTADGAYGPATTAAVEAFQAFYGLPVDGIVALDTWYAIGDIYGDIEGGSFRNNEQYPGYEVGV